MGEGGGDKEAKQMGNVHVWVCVFVGVSVNMVVRKGQTCRTGQGDASPWKL